MTEKIIKMNTKKFVVSTETSIETAYRHFCKAKTDDSLDIMFEGAEKQLANLDCAGEERNRVFHNIYIAFGRRQEDIDGESKSTEYKALRTVDKSLANNKNLSTEELLGEALRAMENK